MSPRFTVPPDGGAVHPRDIVFVATLERLRKSGWRVGVHNDYKLDGEDRTFWLLTHPSGRYVKGEGRDNCCAIEECARQADAMR